MVVQRVKYLPAMCKTWVQSLGQEDPLEKDMATHSCLEKSHGWRSLVDYSPWGRKELDTTEQRHFTFTIVGINLTKKFHSCTLKITQDW